MRLLTFPALHTVGGWGRLVRQRPANGCLLDETAEHFATELAAEAPQIGVRFERSRSTAPTRPADLARTHATLGFLDQGTYALERDGRFLLVDPLSVALFAPFATFTLSHPFGVDHRGLALFLSDDLFFGALPSAVSRAWPSVVPASMRTLVLEQVLRRVVRRRESEEALHEAALALWRSVREDLFAATPFGRSALRLDTRGRHEIAVARARAYLAGAYRGPVALADIARAAFVSVFYLSRIFRRVTGLTLHGYLTRMRVRSALIGIADPKLLFDDVGSAVGYLSPSHFTKIVRQTVGRVPRELRQMILEAPPGDRSFALLGD